MTYIVVTTHTLVEHGRGDYDNTLVEEYRTQREFSTEQEARAAFQSLADVAMADG